MTQGRIEYESTIPRSTARGWIYGRQNAGQSHHIKMDNGYFEIGDSYKNLCIPEHIMKPALEEYKRQLIAELKELGYEEE